MRFYTIYFVNKKRLNLFISIINSICLENYKFKVKKI